LERSGSLRHKAKQSKELGVTPEQVVTQILLPLCNENLHFFINEKIKQNVLGAQSLYVWINSTITHIK
jgi:hypothetical protein